MTGKESKAFRDAERMFAVRVIAMQSAYIEWKRGEGAEGAMEWIENTLDGPDLIPDLSTDARSAQEYFDQEVAILGKQAEADGCMPPV